MRYFKQWLFILTLFLYASAFATVLITAYIHGYDTFLKTMTAENGFFESATVLLLLTLFVYGFYFGWKHRKRLHPFYSVMIFSFAFVSLIAALEEVSWGQQIFHFQSSSFFQENNFQHETNLHNFIPGELFSSIIYSSVYTVFVFIPLFYKLLFQQSRFLNWLRPLLPELHTVLIVLYSASFQVYFYDNFGTWSDNVTFLSAMLLFAIVLVKEFKRTQNSVIFHYIFILFATAISMSNYTIFGFFNMQYEIREMFVVLAALYYFITLTQRLKSA